MKALVACECTQTVLSELLRVGFDAYSCDLQECFGPYPDRHIIGDARTILYSDNWDIVIAHPPCTFLSNAGSVRFYNKDKSFNTERLYKAIDAARFFMFFYQYPGRICIENPVPHHFVTLPTPSQSIQPYWFGDPYIKQTYLWLKGLPGLFATDILPLDDCTSWVLGKADKDLSLGHNRQFRRSIFFPGVARAMATQWFSFLNK